MIKKISQVIFALTLFGVIVLGGCSSSTDEEQDAYLRITNSNYEAVLIAAVGATNISTLDTDAERIHSLATTLLAEHNLITLSNRGLTFVSEEQFSGGINQHYTCDAGGSLVIPVFDFNGPNIRVGLNFNSCFIGTDLFNGDYSSQSQSFESSNVTFNSFEATFTDGSSFTIDGNYQSTQLRAGVIKTQIWDNTDYVKIDTTGNEFRQSNINRTAMGRVHRDLVNSAGYLSLADGSIGLVVPFENNASINAEFNVASSSPGLGQFAVVSNLVFEGDYYAWGTQNPDNRPNFTVPTFPVADLGNTLVLEGIGGADSFTIDVNARVLAGTEQWNAGSLNVIGAEDSRIVMSPSQDVASMVEIRVNDSSDLVSRDWSNGFQVFLSPLITN